MTSLSSITFSQCFQELFCNPYAPFFTGSFVLICLAGMVTFAGEALLVEKVDQYKAVGGTKKCWGSEDGGVVSSKQPVEQLIGLIRNPDDRKVMIAFFRLEKLGAGAEEALPCLRDISTSHSSAEIRDEAAATFIRIRDAVKSLQ